MKQLLLLLVITTLLPVMMGSVVNAQDHERAYMAKKTADLLPYAHIRKLAEKRTNGKIISQRLVRTNIDNWIYQLRIRKQSGHVSFAVVDAKTGKVLSVK